MSVTRASCGSCSSRNSVGGRYFSGEVETFYEIVLVHPGEAGQAGSEARVISTNVTLDSDDEGDAEPYLELRQMRMGEMRLTPTEKDAFSVGAITLEFQRDRHGKVSAVYFDVGRSRDVRAERIR